METPRATSKPSTATNDAKSVKSVPSKEATKIPKPKSFVKDTKAIQTKGTKQPPEDKKFSIRRASKTGIAEKSDNNKLGEYDLKL